MSFAIKFLFLVGFLEVSGTACEFSTTPLTPTGKSLVITNINDSGGSIPGSPYQYEAWTDAFPPTGVLPDGKKRADFNITLYVEDKNGDPTAAFKASWKDSSDFLARTGLQMDKGKKYTQYTDITAEYAYTRSPWRNCTKVNESCSPADCLTGGDCTAADCACADGGVAGDYSYIGVYGWIRNPLVEYYIVDDWFGNRWQNDSTPVGRGTLCYDVTFTPPDPDPCVVGSFTVDGSLYNVYKHQRKDAFTIDGVGDFWQYYSVRANQRQCGTISISKHFQEWEKLGLDMSGTLYEAKLLMESGGGEGSIDYSYAAVKGEELPDTDAASITVVKGVLLLLIVLLSTFAL